MCGAPFQVVQKQGIALVALFFEMGVVRRF